VGGTREIPVDVRIVCATHRDLAVDVREKRFREDLYYRIGAFIVKVPPLRERPADIALLADFFAREVAKRMGENTPRIDPLAADALRTYAWPGNVRELRNAIEHAVILAEGGEITTMELPDPVAGRTTASSPALPPGLTTMRERLRESERRDVLEALAAEGGNQTRAAKRLGMSRRALVYKIAKYGLRG
jgi:DNA-binding NtrC family response regulator